MLREAASICDYLICGLQIDPSKDRPEKNRPVQSIVERWTQLTGVQYVDEIIPYESEKDLEDILKAYPIDIRIIGEEYREKPFTGKQFCEQNGIELYYNSRKHDFSSTELRGRLKDKPNQVDNSTAPGYVFHANPSVSKPQLITGEQSYMYGDFSEEVGC